MEIIQEIGSYAGLAAIVGLAVLSALYFSQARDVRRLRDWAGRAPERTGPLAQPTQGLARPVPRPPGIQSTQPGLRPAAAPAPGTAAASAAGAAPAASNGPAAATPAAARAAAGDEEEGDPADGVSEDTMSHPPPSRLDEDTGDYGPELEDEEPERDVSGDSPGHAEDFEGEYEDEDDWDDDYDEETGDRPAVMPPLPAAGGPARPVPPPPRTTMLPPRAAPVTSAGARPATARPATTSGSGSTILPPYERSRPDGDPWYRRFFYSRGRAALVIGLGVLVLAAATLGGLKLAGGEDEPGAPAAEQVGGAGQGTGAGGQNAGGSGSGPDDPQPAIDPSQVTVAVLNGTTVTGLAADVGDTVENAGYQLGNVSNSLDQERAESVVFYAPGAEVEAEDVGRRLKIAQREQIDPDTQGLAGDASVVVVVGADRM